MPNPNLEVALNTLKFLHPEGGVFELCVISPLANISNLWEGRPFGKKRLLGGWFRDTEIAANLAVQIEAEGIYTTLNPCTDGLLARANQRLKANVDRTADSHIERIRNLLIDIDPLRPTGISSTDQEHENALRIAQCVKAHLTTEGWPEPLVGDSGNGAHLIYPLDLPNNEETKNLLKSALKALALEHQEPLGSLNLEIDQVVFNPARLTKLYGTMVRKGENTQDRPHRLARIISLPNIRQTVSLDLLKNLAATIPSQEKSQVEKPEATLGRFDLESYLSRYGVKVVQVKPHGGGVLYCLQECLFDPSHNDNEAAIGQTAEGKLYYQCFHNSCKGRTWAEARAKISGQDKLTEFTIGADPCTDSSQERAKETPPNPALEELLPWQLASRLFPRIPFPWEVLPGDITDSLQQLGRACATSPYALPGVGFCLMGSILGRSLTVSPKDGWEVPFIFWHMDIRPSGEGKTPPGRLMSRPIDEAQRKEELSYRKAMEDYNRLPRKERDQQPPPEPPRGYFASDLTLEGLRDDLVHSPHGGIVVIQDEISAFLTGQNQYKQKGTDREAWLCLFDGHSARIVRAGRTVYLNGARVSIFGGVQPKVFKTFFAGEDGLYLEDGTLYRFLATCEPPTYYDLTAESWGDRDREPWEVLLHRAMDWVDGKIRAGEGRIEKPTRMILDSESQAKFFEWRNQIYSFKDQLPAQLRGFLPKAVEYVLRLTGVIHCMQMFCVGRTPQAILSVEDLERGIKAVGFYMGQIQDALQLISEEYYSPPEISERSLLLAQTLDELRPHLENGRLAIVFILKQYNSIAPKTQRVGKPRGMGAVLRAVNLNIAEGKHNANGHRSVKCLIWDKNTETFIKQCLQRLETEEWQGFDDADAQGQMSATSAAPANGGADMTDISERMPASETCDIIESQDNADIADVITEPEPFIPSPDWQEVPEGAVIPPGAEIRMNMGTGRNYARCTNGSEQEKLATAETEYIREVVI